MLLHLFWDETILVTVTCCGRNSSKRFHYSFSRSSSLSVIIFFEALNYFHEHTSSCMSIVLGISPAGKWSERKTLISVIHRRAREWEWRCCGDSETNLNQWSANHVGHEDAPPLLSLSSTCQNQVIDSLPCLISSSKTALFTALTKNT